jgi:sensor domain CHASE-containing protein
MFLRNGTAYSTEGDLAIAGVINGVPIPRPAFLALLPPHRQAYYNAIVESVEDVDVLRSGTVLEQLMLRGVYAAAGLDLPGDDGDGFNHQGDWEEGIYYVRGDEWRLSRDLANPLNTCLHLLLCALQRTQARVEE